MSKVLSKDYGSVDYDNLVNRVGDVGSIQLAAGQGTLERGSIIDENGKLLNAATTKTEYVKTSDTAYDASKTYFIKSGSNYTAASITVFAAETIYYERIDSAVKASYVLCDDTETDDVETVTGIVYKNGNFVRNSLVVASGYTFTNADADNLRKVGIIVEAAK